MTRTCWIKCVPGKFVEGTLSKGAPVLLAVEGRRLIGATIAGEAVCVDRHARWPLAHADVR
jgi:hypothetical protein